MAKGPTKPPPRPEPTRRIGVPAKEGEHFRGIEIHENLKEL